MLLAVPQRVSYLNCSLLVVRARRHSQIERGLCSVIETLEVQTLSASELSFQPETAPQLP